MKYFQGDYLFWPCSVGGGAVRYFTGIGMLHWMYNSEYTNTVIFSSRHVNIR